jgi:hypothetical protein
MMHPLRVRNFRLLFAGRVVDELGDAVSPAALTLAIVQATGSSGALAVVLASAMVPRLALLPIGGVLIDRLQPRLVALTADATRGIAQPHLVLDHPYRPRDLELRRRRTDDTRPGDRRQPSSAAAAPGSRHCRHPRSAT